MTDVTATPARATDAAQPIDVVVMVEGQTDRASLSLWPSLTVAAQRTERIRCRGAMSKAMSFSR